jgi:protein TonB
MTALLGIEAHTPTGALVPAVAMSVALHVAVLAGVPDRTQYAADAPRAPLNARLAPIDAPRADATPQVAPPPVMREDERRAPPPPREARRAAASPSIASRVEPVPVPVPAPAPVPPAARDENTVVAAPERAAPPAQVAMLRTEPGAAAGEPSLAPRATPDAVDPGSLGQYRLALIGAARRHKLYPDTARERGWEGRVAIELVIAADGTLADASVKQSSGHGVLDREALEMLRRAARLTPVPPSLQGREFRLDVPVLFELKNG